MINHLFFLFIFSLLNQIQTLPLVQHKSNIYSCPDHCTDVPLNFKLNKEGLNSMKYSFAIDIPVVVKNLWSIIAFEMTPCL